MDAKMLAQLYHPSPVVLDVSKGICREPVRPAEFQVNKFTQEFDYSTLFFDAFFDDEGANVIFIGPSFFNLLPYVSNMTITAFPSRNKCPFRIKNMDRLSQVWATVPDQTNLVTIESGLGRFEISPNRNFSHRFANKRVLVTLSKNNRLEWITDWVRYNRDVHGANAVLFYDNVSSIYRPEELLNALTSIAGIDCVCVVVWPFKYGPQGFDAERFWDSDFCQHGAMEHSRWIGLQQARSVLNSDIDELVVSESNSSIFAAAERSWAGTVRYPGVWVYGIEGQTRQSSQEAPYRFTDFDHYLRPGIRKKFGFLSILEDVCPTKWAVVPSRCPENAQWTAHRIKGWIGAIPKSKDFCYRHFREISDHWKYHRTGGQAFGVNRFEYDKLTASAYSHVDWRS